MDSLSLMVLSEWLGEVIWAFILLTTSIRCGNNERYWSRRQNMHSYSFTRAARTLRRRVLLALLVLFSIGMLSAGRVEAGCEHSIEDGWYKRIVESAHSTKPAGWASRFEYQSRYEGGELHYVFSFPSRDCHGPSCQEQIPSLDLPIPLPSNSSSSVSAQIAAQFLDFFADVRVSKVGLALHEVPLDGFSEPIDRPPISLLA